MENIYEKVVEKIYGVRVKDLSVEHADLMTKYIRILRDSYRSNNPETEYDHEECRRAYMLAYYPNYMELAYRLTLNRVMNFIEPELYGDELKVAYFAAGPGPEVLGSLNAISEKMSDKRITACLLDYEEGWGDQRAFTFEMVRENVDLKMNRFSQIAQCDLRMDCKNGCTFWLNCSTDLFKRTDIYFMFNCINHMEEEEEFAETLIFRIMNMKEGAIFLIVDLNYENVRKALKKLKSDEHRYGRVLDTNINSGIETDRIRASMPKELEEKVFNKDGMLRKLNTQYYYMIIQRG